MLNKYFLDITDIVSPLVAIGFAIYATLNNSKTSDGRISKQGKIAVWGLVLSTLVSMAIKGGNLYSKIENQTVTLQKERTADLIRTAFQDSVATDLKQSLSQLSTVNNALGKSTEKQDTISSDLTQSIFKQDSILNKIESGLNPVYPFSIIYEFVLRRDPNNLSDKTLFDSYIDSAESLILSHGGFSKNTRIVPFYTIDISNELTGKLLSHLGSIRFEFEAYNSADKDTPKLNFLLLAFKYHNYSTSERSGVLLNDIIPSKIDFANRTISFVSIRKIDEFEMDPEGNEVLNRTKMASFNDLQNMDLNISLKPSSTFEFQMTALTFEAKFHKIVIPLKGAKKKWYELQKTKFPPKGLWDKS